MARSYELVLMLDPEASEKARDRVADDARKRIESDGELDQADSWGMRSLAYEIRQRNEADYRFFRFSAENELLEALNHSLKIADGVLRFRIFKVDPQTPTTAPPAAAQPAAAAAERRGERE
jgi:small subunit ribosomal protein S6